MEYNPDKPFMRFVKVTPNFEEKLRSLSIKYVIYKDGGTIDKSEKF